MLHAVLGDEEFAALGAAFVAAQPSVHRSIRWYGGELAQFLARRPPYAEQPIFAELALLEWTLAEVFDAADADPKPRAALSAIDPSAWGELRFAFHPSLRRLHLEWNTAAVWQAMSREEAPPGSGVRRAPRAVAAMAPKSAELFSFHDGRGSGGARLRATGRNIRRNLRGA